MRIGAVPYLFCARAQLKDIPVRKPPLDPAVADIAPTDAMLTVYDEQHMDHLSAFTRCGCRRR